MNEASPLSAALGQYACEYCVVTYGRPEETIFWVAADALDAKDAEIADLRPIAEQAREGGKLKTFISEQEAELSRLRATVERVKNLRDRYRSVDSITLRAALKDAGMA